jgi:arsenite methyltransferase
MSFLDFKPDFNAPSVVRAYDELPLWSAMFGLLMLEEIPMTGVRKALDVGCGTGFPLIELAERLGPSAEVHGIDPWAPALKRAAEKIQDRGTPNVTLHEGSANVMPFDDATFDLIVSNLGLNNFDDRAGAIRECRRVSRQGATLALTTNLLGHMREFYDLFATVLDRAARERLQNHIEHRATVESVRTLLTEGGFKISRVVEREGSMRFANGEAMLNHYFIKLGFLEAWKEVEPDRAVWTRLLKKMNGEVRLTIPMAYIEAT